MVFKLISFLFFLLITTLFIAFNLENRSNISFVFYEFKDIPVFVSLLFAYCAGCLSMLPFLLFRKKKTDKLKETSAEKKQKKKDDKKAPKAEYLD